MREDDGIGLRVALVGAISYPVAIRHALGVEARAVEAEEINLRGSG